MTDIRVFKVAVDRPAGSSGGKDLVEVTEPPGFDRVTPKSCARPVSNLISAPYSNHATRH